MSVTKVSVTNRSNGFISYVLPDERIRREFYPNETKEISIDELHKVAVQTGGRELLYNFLFINDQKVVREVLNIEEELEYWLKEAQIPAWINSCSLDEFKDALDFAPEGIKDLIKKYSVSEPLNDVRKRQALLDILNFSVDSAIQIETLAKQEDEVDGSENVSAGGHKRRAKTSTIENAEKAQPKYKVINVKE